MKNYGSANIKIALLVTGVLIIISTLIYTQILVSGILERERDIANLYAKSIEANAVHGSDSDENANIEGNFYFSQLERF